MGALNKDYKPKEGNIKKLESFLSKLDNKIQKKLLYRYGK
jgi:hypothetical protein